jgi:hypothetical protein
MVGEETSEGALRAMLSAVARHHSGHASQLEPFELIAGADAQVQRIVAALGYGSESWAALTGPPLPLDCANFSDEFIRASDPLHAAWVALYWFLARRLRLADQAATAGHAQGVGE